MWPKLEANVKGVGKVSVQVFSGPEPSLLGDAVRARIDELIGEQDRSLVLEELTGDEYTIADMAVYPWYGGVVLHNVYEAEVFLEAKSYANVVRWAEEIEQRPAVQRGRRVNRAWFQQVQVR